jgi:hypothetical protein
MKHLLLHHLTLTTGDLQACERPSRSPSIASLVRAEGGPIPGIEGMHVDLYRPAGHDRPLGAVFMQFAYEPGLSKAPLVMGIACWEQGAEADAWRQAKTMYAVLRPALEKARLWRDPPSAAPRLPWLAVWLTPMLILSNPTDIMALAAIEQAIVWELMSN